MRIRQECHYFLLARSLHTVFHGAGMGWDHYLCPVVMDKVKSLTMHVKDKKQDCGACHS